MDMKEVRLPSGSSANCGSDTAEGSYCHLQKSGKGSSKNLGSEGKGKEEL